MTHKMSSSVSCEMTLPLKMTSVDEVELFGNIKNVPHSITFFLFAQVQWCMVVATLKKFKNISLFTSCSPSDVKISCLFNISLF